MFHVQHPRLDLLPQTSQYPHPIKLPVRLSHTQCPTHPCTFLAQPLEPFSPDYPPLAKSPFMIVMSYVDSAVNRTAISIFPSITPKVEVLGPQACMVRNGLEPRFSQSF